MTVVDLNERLFVAERVNLSDVGIRVDQPLQAV
jgi:hypothetical protein